MTQADYRRVRALYEQLAKLDEAQRAQALDKEHLEPHLREQLERLFDAGGDTTDQVSERIAQVAGAAIITALPERIGRYRILELIGEGGMGSVFLGERDDGEFDRRVAIKLIRGFAGDTARERFRRERQVLAGLDHPNIALLLDGGTLEDGSPYLVMEFVEGESLVDWLDGEPHNLRQRMRLFAALCGAVHHAHQNLVIHRDLKPSNILVRKDGSPVLLDFGIAKLFGPDSADSGTVTHAMTPAYASPEQLKGEAVTTASDVFGLGLILYRILAGSIPHRGLGMQAIHTELPTLSHVAANAEEATLRDEAPRLRGDLDRIARKAVRIEPVARYSSAQAMAEDVYAWLEGRPVSASGGNWRYLAGKFVRRHPIGIGASVAALLVLAFLVASLGIERQHAVAEAHRAIAEQEKSQQVTQFVQDMLANIVPEYAKGMDRSLLRVVLDSAATRAARQLAIHPDLRAAIEKTLAASYAGIAEYDVAKDHYRIAEKAAEEAGLGVGERARLIEAQAGTLSNLGDFEEALVATHRAFDLVHELPSNNRDRLFIESRVAWQEAEASKLEAAEIRYRTVLAEQRRALGPGDPDTLETQRGMAITQSRLDHHDEAIALLKDALQKYKARHPQPDALTLSLNTGLAVTYLEDEDYAAARVLLEVSVPLSDDLLGPNHPRTLIAVGYLAGALRNLGFKEEARSYYDRAYTTNKQLFGDDYYLTISAESNLARMLRDMGEFRSAEDHARNAVEHAKKVFGPENPATAIFMDGLASILIKTDKFAQAESTLQQAYAILIRHPAFGPDHSRTRDVMKSFADLYAAWHEPVRATEWRNRSTGAVSGKR